MSLNEEREDSGEIEQPAPEPKKEETKDEGKALGEKPTPRDLVEQTYNELEAQEEKKPRKRKKPEPKQAKEKVEEAELEEKPQPKAKVAAPTTKDSSQDDDDEELDDDDDDDGRIIPAPHYWKKEAREHWDKIPRETQEYLLQRDKESQGDYTRKTQEIAEKGKRYQALEEIFTPEFEEELTYRGQTTSQWLKQARSVELDILKNKELGVLKLAARLGCDPQRIASLVSGQPAGNGTAQNARQLDPQSIQQLVRKELQQTLGAINHQQTVSVVDNTVSEFKQAEDKHGNALYPYVDQVEQEMAALIPALKQQNPKMTSRQLLERAYDYCTRGNPEISEKLEQDSRHMSEAQKAAERAEKVEKARRAGVSIPQSSTGASKLQPTKPKEIRDLVSQAYDTLNN